MQRQRKKTWDQKVEIVKDSYLRSKKAPDFASDFYQNLFFLKPKIKDYFKDTDFEAFCEVRDILKNGWTDEIWETFEELFNERVKHDAGLLEFEFVL